MTEKDEIIISENIEKALFFKKGDIISIIIDYNIYFYSIDLNSIILSTNFDSIKQIKNFRHDMDDIYIELIGKENENRFILC